MGVSINIMFPEKYPHHAPHIRIINTHRIFINIQHNLHRLVLIMKFLSLPIIQIHM